MKNVLILKKQLRRINIKMKIKKKLRDLTEDEYREYIDTHCEWGKCSGCIFQNVMCSYSNNRNWFKNKDLYSNEFLNQEIEIKAPSILDEREKEYLSAVIKPFRERVISITKHSFNKDLCFISLVIEPKKEIKRMLLEGEMEEIFLPLFKKNSLMYQGMELEKKYTLEDLEL